MPKLQSARLQHKTAQTTSLCRTLQQARLLDEPRVEEADAVRPRGGEAARVLRHGPGLEAVRLLQRNLELPVVMGTTVTAPQLEDGRSKHSRVAVVKV